MSELDIELWLRFPPIHAYFSLLDFRFSRYFNDGTGWMEEDCLRMDFHRVDYEWYGRGVLHSETEMAAFYEIGERQLGIRCGEYSSRSFTAGFFA